MSGIIVVGVDGSPTARKAAEKAYTLARAMGSGLHVISAFDKDRTEVFGSGSDQVIISDADSAECSARTVASGLRSDVSVTYSAVRGKPAEALINEAARLNAQMIVVGNRRMLGLARVLGSIANSVAHTATCDVYIANTYDAD